MITMQIMPSGIWRRVTSEKCPKLSEDFNDLLSGWVVIQVAGFDGAIVPDYTAINPGK